MPDLAYVVVTYRSATRISACLDAIDGDRAGRSRPIVVVDNASDDRSADVAAAHPSSPLVIRNPTNLGFGAGCDRGAAAVAGDAILFVNPDCILAPGTTTTLLAALVADDAVVAVGPAVVDPSGGYQARSAGREPTARTAIGHFLLLGRVPVIRRLFPAMQLGPTHDSVDVDWVSGAALLVRRAPFEAVGGFDERMFLYMEDVDLGRRLRAAGGRIRYVPETTVEHAMGGSQGPDQVDRWYRAFDAYVRSRHGRAAALVAGVAAFIGLGGRAIAYRLTRADRAQSNRMARGARAAALAVARVPR